MALVKLEMNGLGLPEIIILALVAISAISVGSIVKSRRRTKKVNEYFEQIKRNYPNALCVKGRKGEDREFVFGIPESQWAEEEAKEQKKIEERKRREALHRELREKYPLGYDFWKENYKGIALLAYPDRNEIARNEEALREEKEFNVWYHKQKDFNDLVRKSVNSVDDFGFYTYSYHVRHRGVEEVLLNKDVGCEHVKKIADFESSFEIRQPFYWAYCSDESLDYSLCKSYKTNYEATKEILKREYNIKDVYTEPLLNLIHKLGNDSLLYFASSGLAEDDDDVLPESCMLNMMYLNDLQEKLEKEEIEYCDDLEEVATKLNQGQKLLIVEMVSSVEQRDKTAKEILRRFKDRHPLIAYISVLKEYSTAEMKEILTKKRKAKEEEERKKKLEALTAHTKEFKEQSNEIKSILEQNDINWFYHFTDRANIESIKKHGGLFSWKYCRDNDIEIPNAGGDELSRSLDVSHGLQNYVRLSFCSDHPMAYRKEMEGADIVYLRISTEVATFKSTVFSDMNATDNLHTHGTGLEHLKRVDFNAVKRTYVSRDDEDFKKHQAEIMVKCFIPAKYILNLDKF